MEPFETFEYQGCTIELHQDDDPMSPADWDTLGTLIVEAHDYTFGDDMDSDARDAIERGGAALLIRYLRMSRGWFAIPVGFYDHGSGGCYVTPAGMDDDDVSGFIYTTDKRVTELCGDDAVYHSLEWIETALRGELATWRQYLEGYVCGYVVKSSAGDVIDSCWGFYPDKSSRRDPQGLDYVRKEARSSAIDEARDRRAALRAGIPTMEG